jgi:cadmium resistance protein CadD (predicted permease)
MTEKDLSELTNQELIAEAKKIKSNNLVNAFLIGLSVGIFIYAVAKNNFGFLGLIPIFIAYKIFNKPNQKEAIEKLLKERNLQ